MARISRGSFGLPFTAQSAVESRFQLSQDLIARYSSEAETLVAQLAAADLTVDPITLDLALSVESPALGDRPAVSRPDGYVPGVSTAALDDLATLRESLGLSEITRTIIDLPIFEGVRPVMTEYAEPEETPVIIPSETPEVGEVAIPAAPSLTLPDTNLLNQVQQALSNIVTPGFAPLETLSFDGVFPTTTLSPPDPVFLFREESYRSDLNDALRTKLYNDAVLGGTGLTAEAEAAIVDRAIELLDTELDKTLFATLEFWAGRGHDIPPGPALSAVREDLNDARRKRADLVRDITKLKFDLTQQNTQFAVTNGLVLEKQAMDLLNQVNARALEAAKVGVQVAIDLFNAQIAAHNADLEKVKIQAQVFETRSRAQLVQLEQQKLALEAVSLTADIQDKKVRAFVALYEQAKMELALYSASMDGAKLGAEAQRLKLEGFKELIGAKTAQIAANTARFNLYQAKLAGNEQRAKIYAIEADVFSNLVAAKKSEADIALADTQAQIEANKQAVAVLSAAVEKYRAEVGAESSREESRVRAFTAEVSAYEADTRAASAHDQLLVETYKGEISQMEAEKELLVKQADVNLRALAASKEILAEALKALANIKAQMTASALSSVSASAQLGSNTSSSEGYSYSDSNSDSTSESISTNTSTSTSTSTSESTSDSTSNNFSENHNYNHSA